jgi:Bifunctional DNA primase/polymerase, N-terminal
MTTSLKDELHEAAEACDALGWRTVVVRGKQAMGPWKRPWSLSKIHQRIDDRNATGLAVLLGDPSNGLAARDFDKPDSFRRWSDEKQTLAETLPISLTGRDGGGYHVFALVPGQKTWKFDDGELRGSGAYVVIPPSLHPTGSGYRWLTPPGGQLLKLSPADLNADRPGRLGDGIKPCIQSAEYQHNTKRILREYPLSPPQYTRCNNTGASAYAFGPEVTRIVVETQPKRFGERSNRLWDLARLLRSILPVETPEGVLLPILKEWHRIALPNISTKGFPATWLRFLDAWYAVKHPAGSGLQVIIELARSDDFRTGLRNTNHDLVARAFRAESAIHGGQPFAFSCRALGQCCGMTAQAAQRLALKLRDDGFVSIISNGFRWRAVNGQVQKSGVATVWRWNGPPRMPVINREEHNGE